MKKLLGLALVSAFIGSVTFAADDPVTAVKALKDKLTGKGSASIEAGKEYELGGKKVPGLKFGSLIVNKNENAIVDAIKDKVGGVCTIFIRTGDDFIRASTNVLDKDNKRCMGTLLKNPGPVYEKIIKGETFTGEAEICEKKYNTHYEPIKIDNKVMGIYLCGYLAK